MQALTHSRFRMGWHLKAQQVRYIHEKGIDTIARHTEELIASRLAPAVIPNDGSQTPMKGHPVFIAQHACACCCRGCLEKWYHVPQGVELTDDQQRRIVDFLMAWIEKERNQ